jgi:hypothetical protein
MTPARPAARSADRPDIYYFAFSHDRPTGGNKHTYRHVDLLNEAGLRAVAFHADPGFQRYAWFDNDTPVVGPVEFARSFRPARDFLVLPEDLGARMLQFPGRKVVFNKNIYLGARALGRGPATTDPYLDPTVTAAFAVSDHNAAYLRHAYPGLPVHRVQAEIDGRRFLPLPLGQKRRWIATNAKAPGEVLSLLHLLRARSQRGHNQLADFEWQFLEGRTEQEVADVLKQSLLFVFLSTEEGLARMPAEAMSCGCLVVAYDVGGQREYLLPASRFEVGDFLGMAARIERIAAALPEQLPALQAEADAGREAVARYSFGAQRESVLAAWSAILASA